MITEISIVSLFLGTALCIIGVIGVLRMPDFMNRFHATTIIVTLGTFFILLPVALFSVKEDPGAPFSLTIGELGYAKSAFILLVATWVGGAVGSHAMARAMFKRGMKPDNLIKDQTEGKK
jgi:monovalent cation/proton antiporter MnhG/PhaG subunit